MPHLFTSRPRQYSLFNEKALGINKFNTELTNAVLYLVGGVTFIIGSVCFLPQYENLFDIGAWIFFGGSLIYLVVTGQDLWESGKYMSTQTLLSIWDWLEFTAAIVYVIGTVLFIVGSLFFLSHIDMIVAGSWCFIIGSLLFLIGACVNIIEIAKASSLVKLQLLNITAIAFALGSTLFLVASIPYLWQPIEMQEEWLLFTYVAWEYIVGSILFFVGGIINYYRLYSGSRTQQLTIDLPE
jgi:predicted membrane channel-forming protein YqfA (hemolysin III family)